MIYVFEDGRILCDSGLLAPGDKGKYVEIETLPAIEEVNGKAGIVTGCNLETGELIIGYFDIVEPEPFPVPEPTQPTDLEILMQAQADAELRDFAIQQGQELLAQQMADIELAVLGGAV